MFFSGTQVCISVSCSCAYISILYTYLCAREKHIMSQLRCLFVSYVFSLNPYSTPPHPKNSTTEGLKLCVGLSLKNYSGEIIKDGQRMCKDKSYVPSMAAFQANVYPEDNRNTLTFSAHYFPFQAAKKAQKQTRKIPPICVRGYWPVCKGNDNSYRIRIFRAA